MQQRTQLRDFVAKLFQMKGDARPFDDAEPLASTGRLDSMEIIQLVTFMEESFQADFARVEFDRGDFESISTMLELISKFATRA